MEDSIGRLISDSARLMRRFFDDKVRRIGITTAQWQVLTTLRRNEGCNQGRLAELLEVEPITLCRMVDRLQEAGVVERRKSPTDRRVWQLYLTDRAFGLLEQLGPVIAEVQSESLAGLSNTEQETLRHLLGKIRHNLSRSPAGDDPVNTDPG